MQVIKAHQVITDKQVITELLAQMEQQAQAA
jgi:hypothetical protein